MKKIISFLLIFMLLVTGALAATTGDGMTFDSTDDYRTDKVMTELPVTIEAEFKLPAGQTKRGGVIVGNYIKKGVAGLNIEIHTNGNPRIYYLDNTGTVREYKLTSVNVCTGEWVHMAVVLKASTSKLYWYINGELVATQSKAYSKVPLNFRDSMVIGGDCRTANADDLFNGSIREVLIYDDIRSAEEIASDATTETIDTNGLIAAYRPALNADGTKPETITDLAGNGYDMKSPSPWATTEVTTNPYAYSMAIVGDPQMLVSGAPLAYSNMIDWIADNKDEKNIQHVFSFGNVATSNAAWNYATADSAMFNLGAKVPYSVMRGYDESAAGFNTSFAAKRHGTDIDGAYDATMLNTYRKFDINGVKYLVINLDWEATTEVLAWASELCSANPDCNVIIATHENVCYTNSANAQSFWNNLIKNHSNINLVLCRDYFSKKVAVTTKTGDKGNTVKMIALPRLSHSNYSLSGLVAMMYFSEDGKNVQFRYYSTAEDKYFMDENQFSVTLDTVTPAAEETSKELSIKLEKDEADNEINVNSTYIVSISEGGTVSTDKLTFNIKLNAPISGKMLVARYTASGVLCGFTSYDAARTMNISIDNPVRGEKVKFMWWNSMTGLIPVTGSKWVQTYVIE